MTATKVQPVVEMTSKPLTLAERLLAIAAEVEKIKATGTNQFSKKAISIQDVEDALRDLFIKHGILTVPSWNATPNDLGNGKLWGADLTLTIQNTDDREDAYAVRICDIGTNPSAAESFALKRFYKAMFHLADEDDDSHGDSKAEKTAPAARRPAAPKADKPADAAPKTDKAAAMTAEQRADVLFLNEQLGEHKRNNKQLKETLDAHGAQALIEILVGDHLKTHGKECTHYSDGSDGAVVVKRG